MESQLLNLYYLDYADVQALKRAAVSMAPEHKIYFKGGWISIFSFVEVKKGIFQFKIISYCGGGHLQLECPAVGGKLAITKI